MIKVKIVRTVSPIFAMTVETHLRHSAATSSRPVLPSFSSKSTQRQMRM